VISCGDVEDVSGKLCVKMLENDDVADDDTSGPYKSSDP